MPYQLSFGIIMIIIGLFFASLISGEEIHRETEYKTLKPSDYVFSPISLSNLTINETSIMKGKLEKPKETLPKLCPKIKTSLPHIVKNHSLPSVEYPGKNDSGLNLFNLSHPHFEIPLKGKGVPDCNHSLPLYKLPCKDNNSSESIITHIHIEKPLNGKDCPRAKVPTQIIPAKGKNETLPCKGMENDTPKLIFPIPVAKGAELLPSGVAIPKASRVFGKNFSLPDLRIPGSVFDMKKGQEPVLSIPGFRHNLPKMELPTKMSLPKLPKNIDKIVIEGKLSGLPAKAPGIKLPSSIPFEKKYENIIPKLGDSQKLRNQIVV